MFTSCRKALCCLKVLANEIRGRMYVLFCSFLFFVFCYVLFCHVLSRSDLFCTFSLMSIVHLPPLPSLNSVSLQFLIPSLESTPSLGLFLFLFSYCISPFYFSFSFLKSFIHNYNYMFYFFEANIFG